MMLKSLEIIYHNLNLLFARAQLDHYCQCEQVRKQLGLSRKDINQRIKEAAEISKPFYTYLTKTEKLNS